MTDLSSRAPLAARLHRLQHTNIPRTASSASHVMLCHVMCAVVELNFTFVRHTPNLDGEKYPLEVRCKPATPHWSRPDRLVPRATLLARLLPAMRWCKLM